MIRRLARIGAGMSNMWGTKQAVARRNQKHQLPSETPQRNSISARR